MHLSDDLVFFNFESNRHMDLVNSGIKHTCRVFERLRPRCRAVLSARLMFAFKCGYGREGSNKESQTCTGTRHFAEGEHLYSFHKVSQPRSRQLSKKNGHAQLLKATSSRHIILLLVVFSCKSLSFHQFYARCSTLAIVPTSYILILKSRGLELDC